MSDFSQGAGILAGGFEGFVKGWKDAEDRNYRQMEMDAKIEAQRQDKERQRYMDEAKNQMDLFAIRKEGYKVPQGISGPADLDMSTLEVDPKAIALRKRTGAGAGQIKDDPFSADLRSKWLSDPTTKATREVLAGYETVKIAAKDPSPAGDLSLIFGYMKMLDPGSTVREGEFANAQNAAGLPDQIRNQYNKILKGERLNANQRQDFLTQAQRKYASQFATQKRFSDSIRGIATRRGLRGEDIALDDMFLDPSTEEQVQAPQGLVAPVEAGNEGLLSQGAGLLKRMFMGREKQAPVKYDADVLNYARENNISPEAAQAIKLKRTGGKQ